MKLHELKADGRAEFAGRVTCRHTGTDGHYGFVRIEDCDVYVPWKIIKCFARSDAFMRGAHILCLVRFEHSKNRTGTGYRVEKIVSIGKRAMPP